MQVVKKARLPHGLASVFMRFVAFVILALISRLNVYFSVDEGHYETSVIRLGSRGDSYYEYLLQVVFPFHQ